MVMMVSVSASAGIAKWKHPDGRVGFAAKAADIPVGARIISGSLDPEPPPAPPKNAPRARRAPPAAQAGDEIMICDMDQESIKQLALIGLRAIDWNDPEMAPIRSGKACAMSAAPGIAVNFLGACRRNIARGIETEDQALERLFTNTLVDCADVSPTMARSLKVRDPGARR
jgi:hypothetical protein